MDTDFTPMLDGFHARPRDDRAVSGDPHQLHDRVQLLLAGCHAVSAYDPNARAAITDLIDEMTGLAEDVIWLMPADAQDLADALADAYAALIRLIRGVQRASAQSWCGGRRLRRDAAVTRRQARLKRR